MTNTLIVNLPPLEPTRPPLSGAILAAICKQRGHTVVTVDLQVELTKYLERSGIPKDYFDDVFFEFSPSFSTAQVDVATQFINELLERLDVQKYDYVLCSFFSYLSQQFGKVFLPALRNSTRAKIVIGGAGLTNFNDDFESGTMRFPETLKSSGVIDEYIVGEAENALLEYFQTGAGAGIGNTNFVQLDNLDQCPWPDYSGYLLEEYRFSDRLELSIMGSRGCVRNCTFCDVAKTSPKFRFRSGKNIAGEIIKHYETHGITDYYFADSLVNGSFKAFDEMCNALANYRFSRPISWSGQYIIRSQRATPRSHFDTLKASGCKTLFVGIETGCDRTRALLGKNFTNDDIEFYLENFERIGVEALFLFFTGYVGETLEDHAETLAMFPRWQRYVASGTIKGIETMNILSILPGTPLERQAREQSFLFLHDSNGDMNLRSWVDPANPKLDFKERIRRHVEMVETAMQYKWPIWNGVLSMQLYKKALAEFKKPGKIYIPISAAKSNGK